MLGTTWGIGIPANDGHASGWFSVLCQESDGIDIAHHPLDYDYAAATSAMRQLACRGYRMPCERDCASTEFLPLPSWPKRRFHWRSALTGQPWRLCGPP